MIVFFTIGVSNANNKHQTTQQEQALKGVVKNKSTGELMAGVNVYIKGTTIGTITDADGAFGIAVPNGTELLTFSSVGFLSQEIAIKNETMLYIYMTKEVGDLDQIVVVGYGTTKSRDLTGSVVRLEERDLEIKNVPSAASILQNMASGVMVSGNTGRPGEAVTIRIRGSTSFSGDNNPLYVIDGVPTNDQDALNSISPSDIASFDVLKDASASAIYGSRAANGVIIVTTKKGLRNRKAKFSLNVNSSYDSQIKNFAMLNGDQFRSYLKDLANATLTVDPGNSTANDILDSNSGILGDANTDWFEEVKQRARRTNIDLSVRGGSENVSYFISASILDHKGMVINDDMRRYTGRFNMDVNIHTNFVVGTRISATYSNRNTSGTSLFRAQGHRPDLPVYQADGTSYYDINPVAETQKVNYSDEYRFTGNLYGEWEMVEGLKFRSSFSANQHMNFNNQFTPSFLDIYAVSSASKTGNRGYTTVFDNTISYASVFNEMHSIDFVGGLSMEESASQYDYLQKKGFALDEIYTNVSAGAEFVRSEDSKTERGLFSSFVRINYKYNDKYLLTFTSRYDGSSMFGKNNRFGFFPSGAIAWRVNEENFLKDVKVINLLKLKASVGRTGIQNLSGYSNRDLYKSTVYNDMSGIEHSQIGNRNIRWELSTLYDVGVDFAILNHSLSGSFGYYHKVTKDLIREFTFPSSMAVGNMYYNIGSVSNQGLELNLKAKVINRSDFNFTLGLNLATNKNEVLKLEDENAIENSSGTIIQGSGSQVLAVGHAMGAFLGYRYNGIIPNQNRVDELNNSAIANGNNYYYSNNLYPGNLELSDLNGDKIVNQTDRTIIGNPDPDLYGGITAMFRYKQVSLVANFGFQFGGTKMYSKALQNVPGQLNGLVDYNLDNRWSINNQESTIPAIYLEQGVPALTDLSLFDTSYLRLQDLRITYDLPKLRKVPIEGSVYISGTNIFTITSYPGTDPATINNMTSFGGNYETSYPGIRTFSFGLKLGL